AEADARKAELDTKVKAAEEAEAARAAAAVGVTDDGESTEPSDNTVLDPAVADALLSEADLKKLKRDRTAAGKAVKALEEAFYPLDGMGAEATAAAPTAKQKKAAGFAEQTAMSVTPGLHEARDVLDDAGAREVVLGILRDDLASKLEGHVIRRRRKLVDAYLGWERKYLVSLRDIEARREAAAERLNGFLEELGYVG
ncbi:SAM-dependent DNA methyltransferase, partial [Streptomyces rimosus]